MGKDTLNLRIDKQVKQDAENVLDELGLSMTTAITLYLKTIARTGGIPFSLTARSDASAEPSKGPVHQAEATLTGRIADTNREKTPKHPYRMARESTETTTIKGTTSFKNAIDKL